MTVSLEGDDRRHLFYDVRRPQCFDVPINIYQNEFLSAHGIFQFLGKLRHSLVVGKNDELNLTVFKVKVVGNSPLSLMCVVNGLPAKLLRILISLGTISGPEGCDECLNVIIPLLFFPVICSNVIGWPPSRSEDMWLCEAQAERGILANMPEKARPRTLCETDRRISSPRNATRLQGLSIQDLHKVFEWRVAASLCEVRNEVRVTHGTFLSRSSQPRR